MKEDNALGNNIARLRKNRNLTQAELADRLHFTYQAVSNWERGISEPDLGTLSRLAAYFGVTTDELLGISPPRKFVSAGGNGSAPSEKHRVEVFETVPAAKALRVLLWVYAGLFAAAFLLSYSKNAAVILLKDILDIAAAVANLAVFILFLCAKQPSGRFFLRIGFFVCWIAGEVCSFVCLFTHGTVALVFGVAALLLALAAFVLMPFAFQTEDASALRSYFIGIGIGFAFAVAVVLTAAFSSEFAFYLSALSDVANLAALFFLERALSDRTAESYYYTEQTSVFSDGGTGGRHAVSPEQLAQARAMREQITADNAEHLRAAQSARADAVPEERAAAAEQSARTARPFFREITDKAPVFPKRMLPVALFCAFLLFLLVILITDLADQKNFGEVTFFVAFSGIPVLFGILFFLGKAGRNKVLHIVLAVLWAVSPLLSVQYFICLAFDIRPIPSLSAAGYAAAFAVYAVLLFVLPPDTDKSPSARRTAQGFLLAAAAALTALCIWLALTGWESDLILAAFLCNWGFMLLLFLLHFIKADRMKKRVLFYRVEK